MRPGTFFVVMAGGSGTRFWPRSRHDRPKQLLSIAAGPTLIQDTVARVPDDVPRENILVVTNARQVRAVQAQLELPAGNVLAEPEGRNTAPCIGLAAALVAKRDPDAAMVVMAADHVIRPKEELVACLDRAVEAAVTEGALVTIGIKPTHPATGYGYIRPGDPLGPGIRRVAEFKEKPGEEEAKEFVASGYLWNSGMFAWKASVILDRIAECLPELRAGLDRLVPALDTDGLDGALAEIYPTLPKISIDEGVMERAPDRLVVESTFEWDDVGSFAAVPRHNEIDDRGNTVIGEAVQIDTTDCVIDNREDGLVATLGVEGLIIVRTPDAVLVARKDDAERVKEIVEKLRDQGRTRYL